MISLRSETEVCQSVFGISQHSLPGSVTFSNMYYGGEHPNTHRVLYVNGETRPAAQTDPERVGIFQFHNLTGVSTGALDPWSKLSVVGSCTEDGEKASTILIPDAAHCADMMSKRLHDRASLTLAQKVTQHGTG